MTRKERALKNLKQMCSDGRYLGSGSYVPLEVLEDFDIAIKALEQEPTQSPIIDWNNCHTSEQLDSIATTKNDLGVDAVSRKELLKIYEDRFSKLQKLKHLKDNKGAEDRQMGVNYCINILKELPPVTPIRPKGYWIKIKPYPLQMHEYECSECGHETDDNTESYCSSCGAKMVEPQESEE